ncbi:MAG: hypothetical protein EA421_02470 [Gemmatimonadales bacterium]|nr:MAG: hypothetical protein EA421_02470 [Gemmatimonadales bacterium]
MGVFDQRRDELRIERGFQAAMLFGGAGLVATFYLWFRGIAGALEVGGLMLLCGAALGLGLRIREGSVASATGLLVVAGIGLVISVLIRPFTFDLLSLFVIFLVLRARQAAVSMEAREAGAAGSP